MTGPVLRPPLRLERTLSASPEQSFRAWTDAESLSVWMCPGQIRSAVARCDARVGGRFEIVMKGAERDFAQHGEYLEVDPPKRLVFTWFSDALPEARTLVTIEFAPMDDGRTRLTLVHEDLPEGEAYAGHEQGWKDILQRHAEHLDAGTENKGRT